MPTSARSTVLPLRRRTKRLLDEAKDDATYDDLLRALLRATPPSRLKRALRPPPAAPSAPRSPAKQRLSAELAREGWAAWERAGRARFVAPRVIGWRLREPGPRLGVRLRDRRGLPDEEGA